MWMKVNVAACFFLRHSWFVPLSVLRMDSAFVETKLLASSGEGRRHRGAADPTWRRQTRGSDGPTETIQRRGQACHRLIQVSAKCSYCVYIDVYTYTTNIQGVKVFLFRTKTGIPGFVVFGSSCFRIQMVKTFSALWFINVPLLPLCKTAAVLLLHSLHQTK